MLGSSPINELDDKLRDALQDHAARDTIRRVHLTGFFATRLVNSVISSIVIRGEEIRPSGVESFIIENGSGSNIVDISDFFSRYHLLKLKRLRLVGCRISSWDLLKSRTTTLTTLELTGVLSPITPTLSQLLSILSSNLLLQDLTLSYNVALPAIGSEWSYSLVPLRHLQKLRLISDFHHAFGLLNRLELPDKMKSLYLDLRHCSPLDTSQILGPYLGDRVRRRGRFPGGGLGLLTTHNYSALTLYVGDTQTCRLLRDGVVHDGRRGQGRSPGEERNRTNRPRSHRTHPTRAGYQPADGSPYPTFGGAMRRDARLDLPTPRRSGPVHVVYRVGYSRAPHI